MKTIAKRFSVFGTKLLGLAVVLMIASPPQAPAQQAIGGLRIERTGHTATRLPGGKILVVGGENGNGAVRDSEVFDPASRTFSAATGLLTARADHTATLLPDGRLFVIGGRASNRPLDSTETYDPETGVFASGPSLTRARAGHTATLLPDGRIIVVGGDSDGSIEVFDPSAGAFRIIEVRLAVPRRLHATALLRTGELLIAGGVSSNGAALDSGELLDTGDLSFLLISRAMHVARSRPSLRALPDGKIQVIGGDPDATMELFNPEGRYFSSLAHPAGNPDTLSAALKTQTRAVVLGHRMPKKLLAFADADVSSAADELLDRTGYSLTEIPELHQALAVGGAKSSGQLKTTAALFASSSATVTTDKTDYAPGETVVITGTGWLPGETVTLNIHRDTGDPPDTVLYAVADASGNIQNSEYAVQTSDLGVVFLLTATGQTSGFTAQTSFTDGNIRVRSNAAGITFDLFFEVFSATGCTGTITDSGTDDDVGNTAGTQFNKGVGNTESLRLTAEAFSDQGGNFLGWTASDTSGTEVDPDIPTTADGPNSTNLTICVPGFSGQGARLYIANYVAGNSPPIVTKDSASVTVDEGQTAGNTGTYADHTTVTFTASVGTVTKTGTSSGTWTWSFSTNDGPAQSQTVTITATDTLGASTVTTFPLTVNNVAPTASLGNNGPINEGGSATVSFTAPSDPSSDDTAAGFHYAFSCTNGDLSGSTYAGSGTATSTSCSFDDNGSFPVKARIIDKDGGFTEYTTTVVVNNVAPTASFTGPLAVNEGSPATYSFSAQSDPSSADTTAGFHYAYDCNGGSLAGATYAGSGTSASTSCTFPDGPASVTVRARIIDKDNGFTEYTVSPVVVANVPPTVTAAANQSASEGASTSFSLGSFTDPGADSPWAVDVDWGDLSPHTTFNVTTAGSLGSQNHTYADNGTYTVTVKVTDKDTAFDAKTFTVTVSNVAPTATLANNGPINEGGSATIMFSGQSDPSSTDTTAGFHYAYSCTNGDLSGATYVSTLGSTASTSCSFNDNGSFTVKARIIDKDDGVTEYTTTVVVNNVAPTAVLSNNGPVNEGSPATMSFSSPFDPSSDDTAAGFHYAFSCSGASLAGATYAGSGASASTACTFADNGTYVVTGRILDKDNGSTEYSTSVVVNNVAPTLTAPADQTGLEGTPGTFSVGSFTDPGADSPWAVVVTWGDSTPDTTFSATSTGTLASQSHTYADNGTYTVTVKVTDKDSADSNVVTFQITVSNAPPTATLGNDGPVNEGSPATITFTDQADTSSADTTAGFHYAYSCSNGDLSTATYASGSSTSASTSCTFSDNGSYIVKARIIDKDDGYTEYTTTVTVNNVVPTATLSNNGPVNEGSAATISFSAQFDPSSGDTTAGFHYAYSCSNGDLSGATYGSGSVTAASTSCTFNDNGSYPVKARIIDKDDGFTEYTTTVTVLNVAPALTGPANQTADEGTAASFSLGSFTDPGADSPWAVVVTWGDSTPNTTFSSASTGALASQSHTYADNGTYTVTVKVTDKDGADSNVASFTVTVNNVAPTATLSNNGPIDEGGSATVSFSGQLDPSPVDTAAGFRYAYSCTNGDLSGATYASTLGSSASTSCSFNDNGSYTVKARIIDKDDGFSEYTTVVVVNNVAPTAVLSNGGPVNEGSPVAINFGSQFDPSPADTAAGFHYAFSCSGASLAGATYAGSGASASTACTFADNGTYVVTGRIIDKDNGSTDYSTSVVVNNVAPTLTAPADQTGLEGTPGTFSVGSFTDPGADSPWAVLVSWGDSSTDTTFNATSTGTLASQSHTYADNGTYTVTVKVTDKDSADSNVVTFQITVSNAPPTATLGNNGPVNEGSPATISFSNQTDTSSADTAAGFHYAYSCGNGDLSSATYGSGSVTADSTTCTFDDNGSYTVKARIMDKDDGFTEYTTTVVVNNVAPTAVLGNNGPVNEGSPATISFSAQFDPSSADTAAGFHYAYACDNGDLSGATYGSSGTSASTACTFVDNGTYTVRARIIDKDGGFTEYTTVVTVNNVAPTVTAPAGQSSNEGENKSFSLGSFSDPGTADNPWTVSVNWGDTHSDSFTTASQGATAYSHTYDDNGTYTVTVTVTDKDGGVSSPATTFQVTVANVAPTATLANDGPINEGGSATVSFSGPSDPSNADTTAGFHYAYSCTNGDLSGATYSGSGTSASTSCSFSDNGSYPVKGRIIDKDDGFTEYTTTVVVNNVAPTAVLSNNGPVNEGSPATISFSGQFDPSSDDTGAGFHYAFSCSGASLAGATYAGSAASASAACTFPDNGTYVVTGRIIDKDGGGTEYSTSVTVNNVAPALTSPGDQGGNEGVEKLFDLGSFSDPGTADNPWTVEVNWGDTNSDTFTTGTQGATSHNHTYTDSGTYTVTVKVKDKDNEYSNQITFQVTVTNTPPTATLSNNGPVNEGSPVTITFTSQFDPSAADTAAGFHYAYSCTNGDLSGATYASTAGSTDSTSCTFDDNGTYTVKARIIDKDNGYTEYTTVVTVDNVAPTGVLSNNGPVNEGSPATISFSGQLDPSSADTAAGFHYAYACDNGDLSGATYGSSGTSASTACTFVDNGTYTVKARIIDKDGGFTEYTTTVTVNNVAPAVTAPAGQSSNEGENKSFSLGSFTDPGTADNPWTVSVNWGDTHSDSFTTASQGAIAHSHTYHDNGTYTVTVTVTDKDGGVSSPATTFQVTVSNVAPTATLANDGPINEGGSATVSFSGQFDPSSADTAAGFHYAYACDGGSLAAATYAGSGMSTSTSCSFDDNGSFPVKARIIDKDGGYTEYTTTVVVNNVSPTASFTGPATANEGSPTSYSFSAQSDPSTADTAAGFHYAYACDGGSLAGATYAGSGASATTNCTFPDGPNTVTVRARIIDKDGGFSEYTVAVTVNNVAPVVTAPANQTADEGASMSFSLGSFTDPGADNPWAVDVNWGDATAHTIFNAAAAGTIASQSHAYADNGTYTVTVKVTDKDTDSDTRTFTITVANVAPTATLSNNGPINEGGSATVSFTGASDPSSADTTAGFHYAFSCTNASLAGATFATSGTTASTSCSFDDSGSYPVRGRIIDKDDGYTEYTTMVVVSNVAPTATLSNGGPVNEGSPVTISFSNQFDPSTADTSAGFHYAYACDGSSLAAATYAGSSTSATASCTFPDGPATPTVRARIIDKDGGYTEYTTTVTVNNVAPTITSVTGPTDPHPAPYTNTADPIVVNFTDPGSLDTHTCTFSWDDSTPNTMVNADPPNMGDGSCSGTHTFSAAGVYTIGVTVTDKDGGSATSVFQYVVVYDPGAGFVTGGGWITSPPGAYVAYPALTGKANFGFVSKYKKGATVPTGETEFQFQTAGFNFHSTAYQWLVVSGARAQYKGSGTVNGTGNYGFLLTATDGNVNGGGGVDKFRIKVWDIGTSAVVYDNAPGSDDINTSGQTALGGGSIVIHK